MFLQQVIYKLCLCVCVCVCVNKFSLQTHTSKNWLTMKQDAWCNERERGKERGWCIWLHRELARGRPEGNGASVLLSVFSWFNGRLWISNGTKNSKPSSSKLKGDDVGCVWQDIRILCQQFVGLLTADCYMYLASKREVAFKRHS